MYQPLLKQIEGSLPMTFNDMNSYADVAPLIITQKMMTDIAGKIKSSVKPETEAQMIQLEKMYK